MVPGSGTLVIEQHLDVGSEADHRYDSTEARIDAGDNTGEASPADEVLEPEFLSHLNLPLRRAVSRRIWCFADQLNSPGSPIRETGLPSSGHRARHTKV